jgi:hypothetical protein
MNVNLFNSESIATGNFVWWIGQIVDDSVWKDNVLPTKWKGTDNIPGWGARYKVRILGRDTETKDVPDSQLEMAEVLYPVTAGSGHAGSYQTANLRKGSYVVGFYKDGIDMSEPIIMGCLGNNDQTRLSQSIPLKGFVPFSGYVKEKVSINDIPGEGSSPPSGEQPREGNTPDSTTESTLSDQIEQDDGEKESYLTLPTDCDKLQLGSIQVEIKKFIKDVKDFKKRVNSWKYTILKPISEEGTEYSLSEYIQYKARNVAKWISGKIKNIITDIQQFVTNKINNAAKDFYYVLFPNQRPGLKAAVENANDFLACLFRKIVANLLKMITDALLSIANKFINTPLCAIENIVATLLGNLIGFISSAINAIVGPIEAIIGGIFDLAGGVVNFITDLLSFLSCEEKPECPGVTGWTPWQGSTKFNSGSNVNTIIEKANTIASSVSEVVNVDAFDFNLNFDSILSNSFGACNVGPLLCGPPIVEFYGGGGAGATGNAIVSASGDILGVDLATLGFGYQSAPIVRFSDNCGKGKNAYGRAIINQDSGEVVNVVMESTGFGYLSNPNGDQGGDGSVFATAGQTIVKRSDGSYDRPYNPGEIFDVDSGDEVYSCGVTTNITEFQTLTAPQCSEGVIAGLEDGIIGENPSLNTGTYPVFLELDSVVIDNPGINYSPNDKMTITPDNGAVLQPRFDSLGSLTSVEIVRTGVGYIEMPTIEIETETGYNASLLPVFKVNKLGNITEEETIVPLQSQIISVVDCVGKF